MSEEENKNENTEILKEELDKLKKERDEYLAGWQRAKADFINYKKDEIARLEEIAKYGSSELIRELITVLDNFDLGLEILGKSGPVEKGIYMIRNQLWDLLKRRGLERIEIKLGEEFNPCEAETVGEVESEQPLGTIAEEVEVGYRLHDKILRPARVKISKNKKIK